MSVAVIVTTFNSAAVLEDALGSISKQERQPDTAIVVDDGSRDGTRQIFDRWASNQPFDCRFLRNELSHAGFPTPGPAGSRTTGIQHANTDLIAILDHDDTMLPCHLRRCEEALQRNPDLELVFGDAMEFADGSGAPFNASFFAGKLIEAIAYTESADGLRILTEGLMSYLIQGSFIPTCANMFRRNTALAIGGFDRRAGGSDDVVFFSTLSRMGNVGYFPTPIAKRRIHNSNMSNPRHALRHCWDHLNLLFLLKRNAESLHFTDGEVEDVNRQVKRLEKEVLYHASGHGISVYLDFKRRLGRLGHIRIRDLLRAIVRSGGDSGVDPTNLPQKTIYQMVGK